MTKDIEELERELAASRDRLGNSLDEVSQRMSMGNMLDEVMDHFGTGPKEFTRVLGSQVRQNPMATILAASGIAWLAMGSRKSANNGVSGGRPQEPSEVHRRDIDVYEALERVRTETVRFDNESEHDFNRRLDDAYAEQLAYKREDDEDDTKFRDRIRSAVSTAKGKAAAAKKSIGETKTAAVAKAGEIRERTSEVASKSGEHVKAFHDEYPLVTGAVAVAVGALAGSLLPVSQRERDTLHPVAEDLLSRGASVAEVAADRAKEAETKIQEKSGEVKEKNRSAAAQP